MSESPDGSLAQKIATIAEVSAVEAVAVVEDKGGTAAEAAATDPTPTKLG